MKEVLIYTREYCGYCVKAKRLFAEKGIVFKEVNATDDATKRAEMIQKSSGRSTFPQIFIGGTHVGGCDELHALERAGKLDNLLST